MLLPRTHFHLLMPLTNMIKPLTWRTIFQLWCCYFALTLRAFSSLPTDTVSTNTTLPPALNVGCFFNATSDTACALTAWEVAADAVFPDTGNGRLLKGLVRAISQVTAPTYQCLASSKLRVSFNNGPGRRKGSFLVDEKGLWRNSLDPNAFDSEPLCSSQAQSTCVEYQPLQGGRLDGVNWPGCSLTHMVQSFDTCATLSAAYDSITTQKLLYLNPYVDCGNLAQQSRICVAPALPSQPYVKDVCWSTYTTQANQTCSDVLDKTELRAIATLEDLNPGLDCNGFLEPDQTLCVDASFPRCRSKAAYEQLQMSSDCSGPYQANSVYVGDHCASYMRFWNITPEAFQQANPRLNCFLLCPGQQYCRPWSPFLSPPPAPKPAPPRRSTSKAYAAPVDGWVEVSVCVDAGTQPALLEHFFRDDPYTLINTLEKHLDVRTGQLLTTRQSLISDLWLPDFSMSKIPGAAHDNGDNLVRALQDTKPVAAESAAVKTLRDANPQDVAEALIRMQDASRACKASSTSQQACERPMEDVLSSYEIIPAVAVKESGQKCTRQEVSTMSNCCSKQPRADFSNISRTGTLPTSFRPALEVTLLHDNPYLCGTLIMETTNLQDTGFDITLYNTQVVVDIADMSRRHPDLTTYAVPDFLGSGSWKYNNLQSRGSDQQAVQICMYMKYGGFDFKEYGVITHLCDAIMPVVGRPKRECYFTRRTYSMKSLASRIRALQQYNLYAEALDPSLLCGEQGKMQRQKQVLISLGIGAGAGIASAVVWTIITALLNGCCKGSDKNSCFKRFCRVVLRVWSLVMLAVYVADEGSDWWTLVVNADLGLFTAVWKLGLVLLIKCTLFAPLLSAVWHWLIPCVVKRFEAEHPEHAAQVLKNASDGTKAGWYVCIFLFLFAWPVVVLGLYANYVVVVQPVCSENVSCREDSFHLLWMAVAGCGLGTVVNFMLYAYSTYRIFRFIDEAAEEHSHQLETSLNAITESIAQVSLQSYMYVIGEASNQSLLFYVSTIIAFFHISYTMVSLILWGCSHLPCCGCYAQGHNQASIEMRLNRGHSDPRLKFSDLLAGRPRNPV